MIIIENWKKLVTIMYKRFLIRYICVAILITSCFVVYFHRTGYLQAGEVNQKKKCEPVKNVIFLKTHKTGSSTVISILQRYSERNNLSVAIPVGNIWLGWPHEFSEEKVMDHTRGKTYNIICNHAIFSKEKMLNLMSDKKNTKIVTILREPFRQLLSGAVYFGFNGKFNLPYEHHFVDDFFTDIDSRIELMKRKGDSPYSLVRNPNAFDMGYSIWNDDPSNISMVLESVKRDFDVVMILEKMDESLVLLKNELCWDFEDIAYISKNVKTSDYVETSQDMDKAKENVRNWSKIDYALYNYFNETLCQSIKNGGERFKEDLEKFKALNQNLNKECLKKHDNSEEINGITLSDEKKKLCEQMLLPELEYTVRLVALRND